MDIEDLVIKRVFKCSKRSLFDAWSRAEIMSRWFFAAPSKVKDSEVESDFRVGGNWSVIMFFESGDQAHLHGVYEYINRYSEITFTWNSSIATNAKVSLFIKELSPNRCELKLRHSHFASDENRSMHNNGWEACLANLDRYLSYQEE